MINMEGLEKLAFHSDELERWKIKSPKMWLIQKKIILQNTTFVEIVSLY